MSAVYPFSVKDNITPGREVSTEKIEYALQCVDMLGKIQSLPNGIHTPVYKSNARFRS